MDSIWIAVPDAFTPLLYPAVGVLSLPSHIIVAPLTFNLPAFILIPEWFPCILALFILTVE